VGANAAFIYVFLLDQYHIIALTGLTMALLLVSTMLHLMLFFRTAVSTSSKHAKPKPSPKAKQLKKPAAAPKYMPAGDECDAVIELVDVDDDKLDPSQRGKVWQYRRSFRAIRMQLLEQGTFRWASLQMGSI
jgi:hypothetical protein